MYPISFVLDAVRNNVRRFDIAIEAGAQGSLDPVSTAEAKIAKYIKASWILLGVVLLSVAALRGLHSSSGFTSAESTPQALRCQYMTISLIRGKLVPGAEGTDPAANVLCTATMFQTSQLCREQCTSWAP